MANMLYPKTREEWLELRAGHVSSTESSALFGMSPYLTAFELAVLKKSRDLEAYESNERMQWGLRLQRVIAEGIAEDYGVKIRAVSGYASRLPDNRIGASFDFEIVGIVQGDFTGDARLRGFYTQHGPGVLEIKNVDAWIFKQQWSEVDNGEGGKAIEAPPHIELQVQHQLECIEREWSAIGVLVGGNRQVLIVRMRDRDVGQAIRVKTDRFYKLIERGEMPPVTLPEDADVIRKIYGISEPGNIIDGQDGSRAELRKLVFEHNEATRLKSDAEKHHKSTGAALLMALGTAEKALFTDFTVSAGMVAPTRVEAYDRAGYRNLRVYAKKAKGEKA